MKEVPELQPRLNALWDGVIEVFNIDLLAQEIHLRGGLMFSTGRVDFDIVFKEVSAYYFVRGIDELRFNVYPRDEGGYLELTSIEFASEGIGNLGFIQPHPNIYTPKDLPSCPQIVIEIWESWLLIEASAMLINGEEFRLRTREEP